MTTVRGMAEFPKETPEVVAERIVVEVRDVSLADAPSIVVGATELQQVRIGPGQRLPLAVEVQAADPARHYALRVHVALGGAGGEAAVQQGDLLISTHAHPVLTRGAPTEGIVVPLSLVRPAARQEPPQ